MVPAPALPPAILRLSAMSGSPGAAVTITGTHLDGTTAVRFDGVIAKFKVVSPTKVTAIVPPKAKSGKISLTTKAGTAVGAKTFRIT